METYGERLGFAMKQKGVEQKKLAEFLDIPRPSVSRIINNKQFLDFDLAIKACEILGISLDWLAYGRETEKAPVYYINPDRQRIEYLLTILQETDYKAVLVALEGIIEVRMKGTGGPLRSSGADGSVDASGSQSKVV